MLRPEVGKRLVISPFDSNFLLKCFLDLAAGVKDSDIFIICFIFKVMIGTECWQEFFDSIELGHDLGYFLKFCIDEGEFIGGGQGVNNWVVLVDDLLDSLD